MPKKNPSAAALTNAEVSAAVARWLQHCDEVLEKDKDKITKLEDAGDPNPLWRDAYDRISKKVAAFYPGFDASRFKSAVMSVQSSAGNSAEFLLAEIARSVVERVGDRGLSCENCGRHLVGFHLDHEFFSSIEQLRALVRQGRREEAYGRIPEIAASFFVTEEFVRALLDNLKKKKWYPDSASLFCDGRVCAAEDKLSGKNDSKAVRRNLEALEEARVAFSRPGQRVETVLALLFPEPGAPQRWRLESPKATHVAVAQTVAATLFGTPASEKVWNQVRGELAEQAAVRATRMIAKSEVAPAATTLRRTQAGPNGESASASRRRSEWPSMTRRTVQRGRAYWSSPTPGKGLSTRGTETLGKLIANLTTEEREALVFVLTRADPKLREHAERLLNEPPGPPETE